MKVSLKSKFHWLIVSYELQTIIVHDGDITGGHYFTLQRYEDEEQFDWVEFNDTTVLPRSNEYVNSILENTSNTADAQLKNTSSSNKANPRSMNAYLLFYVDSSRKDEYYPKCKSFMTNDSKIYGSGNHSTCEDALEECQDKSWVNIVSEQLVTGFEGYGILPQSIGKYSGTQKPLNVNKRCIFSLRIHEKDTLLNTTLTLLARLCSADVKWILFYKMEFMQNHTEVKTDAIELYPVTEIDETLWKSSSSEYSDKAASPPCAYFYVKIIYDTGDVVDGHIDDQEYRK